MRRNLDRLANETFDLLIIGGGVTGACVARDAAMRGYKVALVEKGDFANATSAHNSKLIHGGLRYLRNFELGLVRESLRERRIWQRIAPHLVRPLPFLIPVHGGSRRERATLGIGLTLYDVLSFDRTWLDDPAQRLPRHSWLGREKALAQEPVLDRPDFDGAFRYFDAQMYSPERLALENLLDADAHGAALANYVAASSLLIRNGKIEGASVRDMMGNAPFDIRARLTLVSTGPWSDLFLDAALGKKTAHRILRSKGIHLVVPSLSRTSALTVAAGGGHFFILPWRNHTILGTTDTAFTGDPDSVHVTEEDISGFLGFINKHLPAAHLKRSDVIHSYAGLRPLVDEGSGNTYGASRRSELVDHKEDGVEGLYSAIGGKWTTSRDLAEKIVDTMAAKLGPARRCKTRTSRLPGGAIDRIEAFGAEQKRKHPDLQGIDHLTRLYGTRLDAMLAEAGNRPELRQPLGITGDIGAQVLFAIREEMALTLSDVVTRRTGIGQLGRPAADVLARTADIMAGELNWSAERRAAEIDGVANSLVVSSR
ncbi:MAG TPA: glycerol-3-phosphate dehydrogenase/oxidase [Rhizomicrobium sp.]|nr:glycerol-3-phosphate dehydrogenase/oxidase [Rhizomicrobium sp.]